MLLILCPRINYCPVVILRNHNQYFFFLFFYAHLIGVIKKKGNEGVIYKKTKKGVTNLYASN